MSKSYFIFVHNTNRDVTSLVNVDDISIVNGTQTQSGGYMYLKSDPSCRMSISETPEQVMELIKEAYGQE